jgi:DNA polymerase-3 subunit chi
MMPEILFYCLERKTLEEILPGLLERTTGRAWRAIVRFDSIERMNALDTHLWTYSEQSFLAHGTPESPCPGRQPVYLTTGEENPNDATVLFLACAGIPAHWDAEDLRKFERVVVLFDGQEPQFLKAAQSSWVSARQLGHTATLWRQNGAGKWEQYAG